MRRMLRTGASAAAGLIVAAATSEARIGDPSEDFPSREPRPVYATESPHLFLHNFGRMTLQITNLGIIGNPYNGELSLGFEGGEFLSQASLWVGAIAEDGIPHVSASIAGTRRLEFRPSRLAVDTIYPGYEGMPHGNRPGPLRADDDGDGLENEDFLNGRDDDGDGAIDEDFSAAGQQMLACEYRDDTPEARVQIADHVPLGLRVQQRSFQWTEPGFDQAVGLDFAITNIGDQRLRDVYVGLYVDGDIGPRSSPFYFEDDLIGTASRSSFEFNPVLIDFLEDDLGLPESCATSRVETDVVYMWDAPDAEHGRSFGDTPGYLGCVYLGNASDVAGGLPREPLLTTISWTASDAPYPEGDPRTDEERYDLLKSGRKSSRIRAPADYRFIIASGPFEAVEPGERVDFEAALVVGADLQEMLAGATRVKMVYDGARVDADRNPQTGVGGKERCLRVVPPMRQITWTNPCDSLARMTFWRSQNCLYVDDDCNPCTGMGGREHLVHWAALAAPPRPATNTGPGIAIERMTNPESQAYYESPSGDRRVLLQWDNGSELTPDPFTGHSIFEGYRVWKVDGWGRPRGSVGPEASDWTLMAEFRRNPRDGLGVRSPLHLRTVENRDHNDIRMMTPLGPLYHVGRYEWADTAGILNGRVYYYSVTSFGIDRRLNPETAEIEELVIGGRPSAIQKEIVVANWGYGTSCDDVRVVPNPYRGGADWDLNPNDCDASGSKIAFRNLPADWERLDIFTVAGDLVYSAVPGDSRVIGGCEVSADLKRGGTFYWDLLSRSGQNITSGIYLFVVGAPRASCRGRFVVIF